MIRTDNGRYHKRASSKLGAKVKSQTQTQCKAFVVALTTTSPLLPQASPHKLPPTYLPPSYSLKKDHTSSFWRSVSSTCEGMTDETNTIEVAIDDVGTHALISDGRQY